MCSRCRELKWLADDRIQPLMAFQVPAAHEGLVEEVEGRFRLLLAKHIVTGVTEFQFNKWLTNFLTDEDRYLAARLLENLTFRSQDMVGSAIAHILQCILPTEFLRLGLRFPSIEHFMQEVSAGGAHQPVRFVEVEGGNQPGKSGAVLMRELHRLGNVHNELLIKAKDIEGLTASVKALVFVDDMLGTGKQFTKFAKANRLAEEAGKRKLIYCPLAAYTDGLKKLAVACPWLVVRPVEEFGPKHRFFRGEDARPEVWAIDRVNLVADVRAHMATLCERGGISTSGYGLELLIGFHHATPNNTLPVMYAKPPWNHLLVR